MKYNNQSPQPSFTEREHQIMYWVAKGRSNSAIADIMGISRHTVVSYLRRIYLKLNVNDRVSASLAFYEIGMAHNVHFTRYE